MKDTGTRSKCSPAATVVKHAETAASGCRGGILAAQNVWSYSLTSLAKGRGLPSSLDALADWLESRSPDGRWSGKIYVASTIEWAEGEFLQSGCSPNYRAGWWSLTCCKHEMRSGGPMRKRLKHPEDESVFIFTLARQDKQGRQGLVSVAKVTEHFDDMATYADYLRATRDRAFMSSRLTRTRRNDGELGWRFGDCHADRSGTVGEPHCDHVHYDHDQWKRDSSGEHALLVSDCFLLWRTPQLFARKKLKQSRFGHDIAPQRLSQMLH